MMECIKLPRNYCRNKQSVERKKRIFDIQMAEIKGEPIYKVERWGGHVSSSPKVLLKTANYDEAESKFNEIKASFRQGFVKLYKNNKVIKNDFAPR